MAPFDLHPDRVEGDRRVQTSGRVRARIADPAPGATIDAAGNVQPDVAPWNRLGYGNNAIEITYVDVR